MLRGIHKATSNWLGKLVMALVMGLLVVSFAIWGIGDIFRGFGRSTVAKIGSTEITAEQFRQLYSDRLQQLGQRMGRPLTSEQARALGVEQQLLAELVAQAVLDNRAQRFGLGVPDSEVAKRINETPAFRGVNGQFDRLRFQQVLQNLGYTETRFIAEQRRVMLRRQIAESFSGELALPKTIMEVANRYQNEERAIEYIVLDRSKAGEIPAPSPEVLASYFEEHKAAFRAPEYRRLVLLAVTAEDAARWITVSDADAKQRYDERHESYVTPEKRQVQQIVFPNEADAKAAADKLAGGLSFIDLAKERGLKESDIDLGLVTKSSILDRAVADAAFSLAEGAVSAPVKGRFGVVLLRVAKIVQGSVRSFEEVAPALKREIALERGKAEMSNRFDKIEDARAAGQQLQEVAQKLGMTARIIEAIDRSGRDANGAQISDLPGGASLVSNAFSSDVGVENDPLQLQNGGYVWYEVAGITPSRDRKLDEVKDKVEARWRDEQVAEKLKAKATALLDKLKGGGTLAEVAAAEGVKVESASNLKRGKTSEVVSAALLGQVFLTEKGTVGSAEGQSPVERVLFRVTEVHIPPLDTNSQAAKQMDSTLRQGYSDDLLGQYLAQVQSEIGVTINQTVLRQVLGGGGDVN